MNQWHVVTCEYPPQIGGVGDYTRLLALQLHHVGDIVHVWAPSLPTEQLFEEPGITLHRTLGTFSRHNLEQTTKELHAIDPKADLLVQWVPHGYGRRSMNVGFCRWIESLAQAGNRVTLMVHEPCLEPRQGSWKQKIVAQVHRRMIRILLRSASRVLVSIPAWERYLQPYAPAGMQFEWLPIPATIPVAAKGNVRDRFANRLLLGHLGTYSAEVAAMLAPALLEVLTGLSDCDALLVGNGSDRFASSFSAQHPALINRVHATGALPDTLLSQNLSACDLMLQPYPDGLSSRRTSLMNVLAHGIAVVSNSGHLTEDLWAKSSAVALAAPSHSARECIRLLTDPASRSMLAEAGRKLYRSQFDWPVIVAKLRAKPDALSAKAKS